MQNTIEQKDFSELKVLQRPPTNVKEVMAALMLCLGEDPDWANVRKVSGNKKIVERLQAIKPDDTLNFCDDLTGFIENEDYKPESLSK